MLIFISRKERKGRRTSNANYAIAEVVAGYVRQRTQRRNRNEDDDDDEDEDEDDDNVAHRWHRLDGIITDLVISTD